MSKDIYEVNLGTDFSQINSELESLEEQIVAMNDTLNRLSDNGIDIKITMKVKQSKFKKLFRIER